MNAAKELRRYISFHDLDLHFPKPHQKYKIVSHEYTKDHNEVKKTSSHTIIITGTQLFTFNFRFINKSKYEHELKAELFFDNLGVPNHLWRPPCWAVLPFRDQNHVIILESVGWAPAYNDRFTKINIKKQLKAYLLQREFDLSGKQAEFNF